MSKRRLSRRDLLKSGLYSGLALGLPCGFGGCTSRSGRRPNIVLITLDTTRVDHLGCYGYARKTSPALDRLAAESVLYRRAIATSSWTLPSHASLFTGKYTSSHGARYDPEGPLRLIDGISGPASWDRYRARGLSGNETTIASLLGQAGYATGSVVAGPWMKKIFGLATGFDHYDDAEISTVNGRKAPSVTDGALRWIDQAGDSPFFLFLNYYDPHGPLTPPPELAMRFLPPGTKLESGRQMTPEQALALYDAEILYMDRHIGRLLGMLQERGIYDNTWIIVTADHGELFGEHGKFGHGHYLFQEEIHIPLFMKYPHGEMSASHRDELVSQTDILPLICSRMGLAVPEETQGRVPGEEAHPIVSEAYPLASMSKDGDWRALFEGEFKLLWNSKAPALLYDLSRDPSERDNLADSNPRRVNEMTLRLEAYLAGLPRPQDPGPDQGLDEETTEALKSLGYLN